MISPPAAFSVTLLNMFTGIVETKGTVRGIADQSAGKRLSVAVGQWQPRSGEFRMGDSICVSGTCLTVAGMTGGVVQFDVIHETLNKTTLGGLRAGDSVNLESSLTATTPMGGHMVQGHIDGLGVIHRMQRGNDWRITVRAPAEVMEFVIPKGSITIDGVSLTVASVTREDFTVALIPTTLDLTTLGEATDGQRVNLETDIVSRTVVHWLKSRQGSGGVNMDTLRRAGFLGQ